MQGGKDNLPVSMVQVPLVFDYFYVSVKYNDILFFQINQALSFALYYSRLIVAVYSMCGLDHRVWDWFLGILRGRSQMNNYSGTSI